MFDFYTLPSISCYIIGEVIQSCGLPLLPFDKEGSSRFLPSLHNEKPGVALT